MSTNQLGAVGTKNTITELGEDQLSTFNYQAHQA